MELTEINSTSFPIKLYSTYTLNSSKSGYFSLISKSVVEIIRFKPTLVYDLNAINVEVLQANCDTSKPAESIKPLTSRLMNNSKYEDRLQLLLDNTLMPGLSTNSNARLVDHVWAPITLIPSESLLLTLTNNGVLILNSRETNTINSLELSERKFLPIKNLTDLRMEQLAKLYPFNAKPCSNITDLQNKVYHVLVQSVCWLNELYNNEAFIVCSYRNTEMLFYNVAGSEVTNLNVKLHDEPFVSGINVNIMNWFLMANNQTFLICGCETGEVKLFRITISEQPKFLVEKMDNIWDECDGISIRYINVKRCNNNLLIVLAKEQHILMNLVDTDGKCLMSEIYHFDRLSIGGITDISDYSYIIASHSGYIEFMKINIFDNSIGFTVEEVKCGVDCSKWKICGVSSSENKCLVIFAVNPLIDFDHLQLRCPTSLIICHFSSYDPYTILKCNKSYNLSKCYDAIETIRQFFWRNKEINEDFMGPISDNINLTDEFIYRLRLKLIVFGTKAGYFRFRSEKRQLANLKYFEICTTIIETILALNNLSYLNNFYKKHSFISKLQMQAAKSIRIFLLKFSTETFEVEPFDKVQQNLQVEIKKLLDITIYLDACESELCNYCLVPLPNDQLICEDGHQNDRCFITQMQIPNFKSRWCRECRKQCLVEESINEIFSEKKIPNTCFICGLILVSYPYLLNSVK